MGKVVTRRIFLSTCVFVFITLLTACASRSIVMDSALTLPDNELSILKIDKSKKAEVYPQLNGIVDIGARKIVLRSEGFKDYYKIKIAPGDYDVMLKVYSMNYTPAFPHVRIKVKAGMTYLFTSSLVLNGKAVTAEYKEIQTALDTTPDK